MSHAPHISMSHVTHINETRHTHHGTCCTSSSWESSVFNKPSNLKNHMAMLEAKIEAKLDAMVATMQECCRAGQITAAQRPSEGRS